MRTRTVIVIAVGVIVLIAFVRALAGDGARTANGARPESRATLVGTASFVGDLPTTNRGTVRLVVRGVAENVSDTCRSSGEQGFTATYDGELVIDDNNSFTASLYPSGVLTTAGCPILALRVDHVDSIELQGQLGDVMGRGALRFQNLAAVDGDELMAGAFDDLNGDLVFEKTPAAVSMAETR